MRAFNSLSSVLASLALSMICVFFTCPCAIADNAPRSGSDAPDWHPERTWIFSVGVLEWKDGALQSYTKVERKDEAIVEAFRTAGVPEDRIVFIKDNSAELAKIQDSLDAMLKRTVSGDTLFFYYCGHGFTQGNDGFFANYDHGTRSWSVRSIVDALTEKFKGSTVFLTADCCHSGWMAEELKKKERPFEYAVLASVVSDKSSTNNWTFSTSWLNIVSGRRFPDYNDDGRITLSEAMHYVKDEMTIFEKQNPELSKSAGMNPDYIISLVKNRDEKKPERVKVLYSSRWWPARLLERKGDKGRVHWVDITWDNLESEEWVDLENIRPL